MANNLTTYASNHLLDHVLGKTAYTEPSTFVCLFTANPTATGDLTNEVGSGVGYARQPLSTNTTAASAGAASNSALVEFGAATGAWGTITYVGIIDIVTLGVGNLLWYAPLASSRTIASGDKLDFQAGDLAFTMD